MAKRTTPAGWRGMLMKGELVRATLEDRKTETRRLVKATPPDRMCERCWNDAAAGPDGHYPNGCQSQAERYHQLLEERASLPCWALPCPYGKVGDRIWVRETFYCDHYEYPNATIDEMVGMLEYRAEHHCSDWEAGCPCADDDGRSMWRPSIHMPFWASRLALEIVEVRVERLQDIDDHGIEAEGVGTALVTARMGSYHDVSRRSTFRTLWDEINGARASWDSNPWVWVIRFRRLDGTPQEVAARG